MTCRARILAQMDLGLPRDESIQPQERQAGLFVLDPSRLISRGQPHKTGGPDSSARAAVSDSCSFAGASGPIVTREEIHQTLVVRTIRLWSLTLP